MKVATLIEALSLVGGVYRNKDGSRPADAVVKLIHQLSGADDLTLAEWVTKRRTGPGAGKETIDQVLARLESAATQAALRAAIERSRLSADEWKRLVKKVTGKSAKTGPAARDAIQAHFSDAALLNDRIGGVRRLFG